MQIREIYHHQLQAYIDSEEYKRANYIAISKHRALSHLKNPRAKADDLVLVLIYEGGEMVAYLGVFADDLHFTTGIEHVGWLSCMWVNPIMRGKGIAKKLIHTVFEAWSYKILVTEFTPAAEGLYNRTGQFIDLAKPRGLRGYLRLNLAYLLPKKDPKWNKWAPLLSCIDGLFNLPNALRLQLKAASFLKLKGINFEYLSELDDETWAFIQKNKLPELMNRDRKDLTWLTRNPWLISSKLTDYNASRYHFSATDSSFNFLNVKIYNSNLEVIGFLILSIRGKNMKVPYAYVQEGAADKVLQVIYKHLIALKLDMLTVFHPVLVKQIAKGKAPFFLTRNFQRHYIIGKVLEDQLVATPNFVIQDGDADAAFT
ncbi:GNAT family N-acetyltransferase [Aureispira anguillae]|uniref:GNAT family N-acetyltransferase n=1 Tax=Aureispira anguillae TaxID=2864201 RepID=A0A915YHV5_9BACT|nr:GNAT family N-acetyltransferase [Aureispira anguillae]BDS13261.1 GNAT family N-acetyltransferase [Aureispira anguillae]